MDDMHGLGPDKVAVEGSEGEVMELLAGDAHAVEVGASGDLLKYLKPYLGWDPLCKRNGCRVGLHRAFWESCSVAALCGAETTVMGVVVAKRSLYMHHGGQRASKVVRFETVLMMFSIPRAAGQACLDTLCVGG